MSLRHRITGDSWERIQNQAKADAQDALEIGETKGLTALGLAYYQKFLNDKARGFHNRSVKKKPQS
jgi:hypothetical protein